MKKGLLPTLILLTTLGASDAFAQFNQGRFLVGGSVNFSATTYKSKSGSTITTDGTSTSVGFSPSVGYFFMDNLAVGASLNVGTGKTKTEGNGFETSSSSVSIGPFVRYYLPVPVFVQGTLGFGSSTTKILEPVQSEFNASTFNWGLAVGYAYFLNDFVAIEPIVGYQNTSDKDKDSNNKDINGTLYLSAALTVYLGERK